MLEYAAAEFFYESPDVAPASSFPRANSIPKSEESFNHTARVCRIGPDNKLYIQLGQPYNVPAKEKLDLYRKWGIGGIIRMDRDGKNREVYATGLRNPVGMDFNPKDKTLWTNDNQVDGMGDDQPPGEMKLHHCRRSGFRVPLVWRRADAHDRIQERHAARERHLSGGGASGSRGRSRSDLLHGQHVSEEVSGCDFFNPAWILELYGAGRRAGNGDVPQGGWTRRRKIRAICRRLERERLLFGPPRRCGAAG